MKPSSVFFVVLLLISSVSFSGCKKDELNPDTLHGNWKMHLTMVGPAVWYEFKTDGSFALRKESGPGPIFSRTTWSGTYIVNDGKVQAFSTRKAYEEKDQMPVVTDTQPELIVDGEAAVLGDILTIEQVYVFADGSKTEAMIFTRVK